MADIFISYSKAYRALTEALAKDLEARGHTVWWDTSLLSGETFRTVILRELDAAKAVIVIWSPASVKSDWVVSEATRAKQQGKLITVLGGGATHADIPPPFDVLHADDVEDRAQLLKAIASFVSNETFPEVVSTRPATNMSQDSHPAAEQIWQKVKSEDTIGSYLFYIKNFPHNQNSIEADERIWRKVEARDDVSSYQLYLKVMPNDKGHYKPLAIFNIEKIKKNRPPALARFDITLTQCFDSNRYRKLLIYVILGIISALYSAVVTFYEYPVQGIYTPRIITPGISLALVTIVMLCLTDYINKAKQFFIIALSIVAYIVAFGHSYDALRPFENDPKKYDIYFSIFTNMDIASLKCGSVSGLIGSFIMWIAFAIASKSFRYIHHFVLIVMVGTVSSLLLFIGVRSNEIWRWLLLFSAFQVGIALYVGWIFRETSLISFSKTVRQARFGLILCTTLIVLCQPIIFYNLWR